MKIRIFALAKELGLDSKDLIELAANAGVQIKNSALASISPEEKEIVLNYIKEREAGSGTNEADNQFATSRQETSGQSGMLRTIRQMTPRAQGARSGTTSEPPTEDTETATATEIPPEGDEPEDQPVEEEAVKVAAESETETATEADAEPSPEEESQEPKVKPISRDEYVPAPTASSNTIREMKPRGNIGGQRKPKPKPAMPALAAPPTYTPPVKKKKKEEPVAQKPDIPLTAESLAQQSPLQAHMQQQKQNKKKGGKKEPVNLLEEARRSGRPDDQRRRKGRRGRQMSDDDDRFQRGGTRRRRRSSGPIVHKTEAAIDIPITLRAFSEALGRPAKDFLTILFNKGASITINDLLDEETAMELAMEVGVDLEIRQPRDIENELSETMTAEEPEESLVSRPPIVTILGHVDHGKTSLLDKIRSASVASGEAGGITQHIAAYQVKHNGQKVTFVDTPGHAAFSEMRGRGANVTDIVVLVVAADDGVMPQTIESISHARSAGVPLIVAMNKIDLASADEQKVLTELSQHDVLPAEWGGDVEVVRTSAETGQGIDDLLETILLTAELQEYKANPERNAYGVCLESFRDEGRGALAWLVVQQGTLAIGDVVLCGHAFGRIRAMYNDRDEELEVALPSTPIKVAGLDIVPDAGNHFFVMSDIEEAREAAESRRHKGRTESLSGRGKPRSLEDILEAARGGEVQDLPLIIKADTPGSLEAIRSELEKFEHPEVKVKILHEGVGGVNESDVTLAVASGAIVIAFHVIAEERAETLANKEGIDVRRYSIIYEVIDEIKQTLEGMLKPERVEVTTGRALVLRTFHISRFGTIAGCRVLNGTIERSNRCHVIRDQTVLKHYPIASLKREKDDAKEVREGMECGIRLDGFNDVKEGDLLEAFRIDEIKRTLE